MQAKILQGQKIAILVANGFEQIELEAPKRALEQAGAEVDIISPEEKNVKGWQSTEWGDEFRVDVSLDEAKSLNYSALVLPGGVINPDKLRINPRAIEFIKEFYQADKPIAAICHGPLSLINAEIVKGRKMTSYSSIQIDLKNAGAKWVDEEVVRDGKLVTSRKPDDLPAFNREMLRLFAENISN